jgi:hypothetical protein
MAVVAAGLMMLAVGGCAADVYDGEVYAPEPVPAGYAVYGEPYPYTYSSPYPYYYGGYSGYAYPRTYWRYGDGWHGVHDGGDWRHDRGEWHGERRAWADGHARDGVHHEWHVGARDGAAGHVVGGHVEAGGVHAGGGDGHARGGGRR